MRTSAFVIVLTLILSSTLVVANTAKSKGENAVSSVVTTSSDHIAVIPTESEVQVSSFQAEVASLKMMQAKSEVTDKPAVKVKKKIVKHKVKHTVKKTVAKEKAKPKHEKVPRQPSPTSEKSKKYSDEEINLLARIVTAEAKDQPYKGQVAVAAVVLNRVEQGWGKSIRAVVYARGQFQPVRNGMINRKPTASALKAAKVAIAGYDPTGGSLYFANMSISTRHPNSNAKRTCKIGDHTFFV